MPCVMHTPSLIAWLMYPSLLHRLLTFAPCLMHTPPILARFVHPPLLHCSTLTFAPSLLHTPLWAKLVHPACTDTWFNFRPMLHTHSSFLRLIGTSFTATLLLQSNHHEKKSNASNWCWAGNGKWAREANGRRRRRSALLHVIACSFESVSICITAWHAGLFYSLSLSLLVCMAADCRGLLFILVKQVIRDPFILFLSHHFWVHTAGF